MAPHAVSMDSPTKATDFHAYNVHSGMMDAQPSGSLQQSDKSMPIAIVGMGCRCPGDATNPENLWRIVSEARETWSQMPESKYSAEAFYHPDTARNGTVSRFAFLGLMFDQVESPTFVVATILKKTELSSTLHSLI